ncbi:MAG: hypothetical protein ACOCQ4_03050 [bacterium]
MKFTKVQRDVKSQEQVKEVLFNSPQDKNYLSIKTPLFSDYGDNSTNIRVSVNTMLVEEGFNLQFFEEKDENGETFWMNYYSNGILEVYNLIKPDSDSEEVEATYLFKGSDELINEYRDHIRTVVNAIMDGSLAEN